MLSISKETNGNNLTIVLSGRLDTTTASELESELQGSLDGMTALIMDCKELEYISSAGLRVLLSAQKTMNKQGSMIVRNASDEVKEIFKVTGFSDILTIE